ncbi:hypothetical protein Tco_1102888 [Tanacetum coccineum]
MLELGVRRVVAHHAKPHNELWLDLVRDVHFLIEKIQGFNFEDQKDLDVVDLNGFNVDMLYWDRLSVRLTNQFAINMMCVLKEMVKNGMMSIMSKFFMNVGFDSKLIEAPVTPVNRANVKNIIEILEDLKNQIKKALEGSCSLYDSLMGGNSDQDKISWIAWKKVTLPCKSGDLGIKSLMDSNQYLLAKWWWGFRNEENALWFKVIRSIHGSSGGMLNAREQKISSGTWSHIIKLKDDINIIGINLKMLFKTKLGNRMTTSFCLPTRVNLDHRGIDLDSVRCSLSSDDIEIESHVFINCYLALVLQWSLRQLKPFFDVVNEARGAKDTLGILFFGEGADEELSDGGSIRVIVYGYDGLPMLPVAPPSLNYVPGPEHPPSPE